MIDLNTVTPIRIERLPIKNRHATATCYILKCLEPDCNNEIRVYKGKEAKPTGRCRACCSKSRPFQYIYNSLLLGAKHKAQSFDLTYEEFVSFTHQKTCHYCRSPVEWLEWSYQGASAKYNLDRKDSGIGYTKENCVVCCTSCNYTKGARFTYDEFMLLSPGLTRINEIRSLSPS